MPKPRVVPAGEPRRMPEVIAGFSGIERHAVLVAGDVGAAERDLGGFAGELLGPEIDQHQMGVGAAGDERDAALDQGLAERLGVVDHALGVELEIRLERLAEGDGLGGDDMHQRAALETGEQRRVDLLADLFVIGQHHAGARAAQGLVGGGGDHVGVRQRARMETRGDQAGEMRHVDHEIGADRVRRSGGSARSR